MGTSSEKLAAYRMLVQERKTCRDCKGLTNPSECVAGVYDSDHIGPWSRWQGKLDSELIVIGQDWGDEGYFVTNRGHEFPNNKTNETLRTLLASISLNIEQPSLQDSGGGTHFFTNAVLCL